MIRIFRFVGESKIMKKRMSFFIQLVFIVILTISLFAYAMFQGGFTSWFLFYSFLPILLYQILFLIYPLRFWKVSRRLSNQTSRAGESITVEITFKRRFPFPLFFCVIEEVIPNSLQWFDSGVEKYVLMERPEKLKGNRKPKMLLFPLFKRTIRATYELEQLPRGRHHLEKIRIRTSDLFGFTHKEHHFSVHHSLLVFPNKREILWTNAAPLLENGQINSHQRSHHQSNIATEIREYLPGDKLSWIDWKQSAKKQKVMTKEFEQEKNMDISIILDACTSKNMLAFEGAVEISLSLIDTFLEKGETNVDFLSIGKETLRFSLHRNHHQIGDVYQYLASVQLEKEEKYSFLEILQKNIFSISKQRIIFFVLRNIHLNDIEVWKKFKGHFKQAYVFLILPEKERTKEVQDIIQILSIQHVRVYVVTEQTLMKRKALEVGI